MDYDNDWTVAEETQHMTQHMTHHMDADAVWKAAVAIVAVHVLLRPDVSRAYFRVLRGPAWMARDLLVVAMVVAVFFKRYLNVDVKTESFEMKTTFTEAQLDAAERFTVLAAFLATCGHVACAALEHGSSAVLLTYHVALHVALHIAHHVASTTAHCVGRAASVAAVVWPKHKQSTNKVQRQADVNFSAALFDDEENVSRPKRRAAKAC